MRDPGLLSQEDIDREKEELRAILSSKLFVRAPSQAKLLSYICEKYFDGKVDQIKEYTIAVELFKRPEDFQSKEDPIVRVEANRLRVRLKDYYHTEGKGRPIQIFIPSGQYVPRFQSTRKSGTPGPIQEHSGGAALAHCEESPDEQKPAESESVLSSPVKSALIGRLPRALYFGGLLLAGLVLTVTCIVWWPRLFPRRTVPGPDQSAASADTSQPGSVVPAGAELRIMAGSNLESYIDPFGKLWVGDRYFKGGEGVQASPTSLLQAEDSHLCRFSRQGDFEYNIPLKRGVYELHLYFVEMQFGHEPEEGGETSRLFSIFVNRRPILDLFDVYSDAGGCGKLDERVFTDLSPDRDGLLHISFRSFNSRAMINGLEILPGVPGRMRPVRIITRPSSYISADHSLWEADRYFSGGRSVVRLHAVGDPKEPDLYRSERYGNFTYTIPLAQGRYRLTLKFAETYFGLGPTNPPGEGPGMRLFDVYCNGLALLRNFDITSEAGGKNRSLDRVFHALEPNAQGKLVLTFVPVKNYACINAIEIVPEPETPRKR